MVETRNDSILEKWLSECLPGQQVEVWEEITQRDFDDEIRARWRKLSPEAQKAVIRECGLDDRAPLIEPDRPQDIYLVLQVDRHSDIQIYPFRDEQRSLNFAQSLHEEYVTYSGPPEKGNEMPTSDAWLFYGPYGSEGDYVRVMKVQVQDVPRETTT